MNIVKIRSSDVKDWIKLIPLEILSDNGMKNIRMLGVEFTDQKTGAIVWNELPDEIRILSIYVDPGARRMGLGSELLRAMKEETGERKLALAEFEYSEEMEKDALTPFLERFGAQIHKKSFPLGLVVLKDVCRAFMKQKINPQGQCAFSDLSMSDKNTLHDFIRESTGLDPAIYFQNSPGYVVVDNGKPLGMMLMRDSYAEKTIYIDYLWAQKNPRALQKIISAAFKYSLEKPDKEEILVHFILATKESKLLYEAFFGPVQDSIVLCNGFMDMRVIDGL